MDGMVWVGLVPRRAQSLRSTCFCEASFTMRHAPRGRAVHGWMSWRLGGGAKGMVGGLWIWLVFG